MRGVRRTTCQMPGIEPGSSAPSERVSGLTPEVPPDTSFAPDPIVPATTTVAASPAADINSSNS